MCVYTEPSQWWLFDVWVTGRTKGKIGHLCLLFLLLLLNHLTMWCILLLPLLEHNTWTSFSSDGVSHFNFTCACHWNVTWQYLPAWFLHLVWFMNETWTDSDIPVVVVMHWDTPSHLYWPLFGFSSCVCVCVLTKFWYPRSEVMIVSSLLFSNLVLDSSNIHYSLLFYLLPIP